MTTERSGGKCRCCYTSRSVFRSQIRSSDCCCLASASEETFESCGLPSCRSCCWWTLLSRTGVREQETGLCLCIPQIYVFKCLHIHVINCAHHFNCWGTNARSNNKEFHRFFFLQSQCSFPFSQFPATFPCPEADRSCPPLRIVFFKFLFNIILSSTPRSSNRLISLQLSNQIPVCIPRHPLCLLHARPISSFSFDHSNNIWRRLQILKLSIMKFSPVSDCLPQYTLLDHP